MAPATPAHCLITARLAVEPEIARKPVRLVPEQDIGADIDSRVDPEVQKLPEATTVEAGDPDRTAVRQDLTGVHLPRHELAERLPTENTGHTPGIEVRFHAERPGDAHDFAHRFETVQQIVLGEAMHDVVEPGTGNVAEISLNVAKRPVAKIRDSRSDL